MPHRPRTYRKKALGAASHPIPDPGKQNNSHLQEENRRHMTTKEMVATLDAEIARLRQVQELLAGAARGSERVQAKVRLVPGAATTEGGTVAKKRTLSPEARERIAAAQRARWAAHTAAKSVANNTPAPPRGRGRPKKQPSLKKSATRSGGAQQEKSADATT